MASVWAVTGPQPRPNVSAIPAYVAGKPPQERPDMTSYKLSSNENPYPPLPGVVEAANRAAEAMNRGSPWAPAMSPPVTLLNSEKLPGR